MRQPSRVRPSGTGAARRARRLAVTCWLALVPMATAARAAPPPAPAGGYVTNGPVHALAQASGRTFLGGDFTRVGLRSGAGVRLSSTGAQQQSPEVAGGEVRAVASDGAGGWYIGGTFDHVGGQSHLGLAHVLADGSVDGGFNPGVFRTNGTQAEVDALAYSNSGPDAGTLYVGGRFDQIGPGAGETHANLAALRGAATLPEQDRGKPIREFNPAARCVDTPSCTPAVRALALAAPSLLVQGVPQPVPLLIVGGEYTRLGPSDAPDSIGGLGAVWGVGALDKDGGGVPGAVVKVGTTIWAPFPTFSPATVRSLQLPEDLSSADSGFPVYVGGDLGSSFSPKFAGSYQLKLDPTTHGPTSNGGEFSNWNPAPGATVRGLAATGGKIYLGGDFTGVAATPTTPAGTKPAAHLARIAAIPRGPSNSTWLTTSPGSIASPGSPEAVGAGVPARVRALAVDGGSVLAGGDFPAGVSAVGADGAPVSGWQDPVPDSPVHAISAAPGSIYMGGAFRSVHSQPRAGLAAFDSSGGLQDWNPGVAAESGHPLPLVRALAAAGDTLYVGGKFDSLGGMASPGLGAVDVATGAPHGGFAPSPSASGRQPLVTSLAVLGSTLYVGGTFERIGGRDAKNLAALDTGTGAAADWAPAPNDNVYAILPACGAVYVGGGFTQAGGTGRNGLAAIDPATGRATAWNPAPNGSVFALARFGDTLYVGGTFSVIGSQSRHLIAGVHVADGTATGFDAGAVELGDGPVRSLAATDTTLYVGGQFRRLGGARQDNLAALDPAGGGSLGWAPDPDAEVRALLVADDSIHAGGDFGAVGASAQRGFSSFGPGAGTGSPPQACDSPRGQDVAAASGSGASAGGVAPRTGGSSSAPARASGLVVSPSRLRLTGRPLRVRFRLSNAAPVRLRFDRRATVKCRSPRARRTCRRFRLFAGVGRRGKRGLNVISFPRHRVARRRFLPGYYRLTLTVLNRGRAASSLRVGFRVVRR